MNGIQCKLARTALGWGVLQLADVANVSTQTVVRLEKGEELRQATLHRIQHALEEAGIIFISEDDFEGVGIRLRKAK